MMKPTTIKKIKTTLAGVGAFASAISGLSLGLLSLFKVFYPDPKTDISSGGKTNAQ